MTRVFGWDLGGANVKLARVDGGRVVNVAQIPCPIIPERSKFDAAVDVALPLISSPALHALTMTGELSDVFNDRAEGVSYLVELMQRVTAGQTLRVYAGSFGFLDPDDAKNRTLEVASANWHATAALIARHHQDALLVDVGTTTTDLIPIKDGAVAARGATDAERLTESELLYTGVVRTPVMAVAHSAPFKGRVQRIAAERFATMADVWRLTGDLPDDADPYPARRSAGKERTGKRGAARPHAWARRKRGRAWRVGGARALLRRLPACRDRACGARSRRARRPCAERAGHRCWLRAFRGKGTG